MTIMVIVITNNLSTAKSVSFFKLLMYCFDSLVLVLSALLCNVLITSIVKYIRAPFIELYAQCTSKKVLC